MRPAVSASSSSTGIWICVNFRTPRSTSCTPAWSCSTSRPISPSGTSRNFFASANQAGWSCFSCPSETRPESVISAEHALPDSAYVAAIVLTDPPASLESSEFATLGVVVTNASPWRGVTISRPAAISASRTTGGARTARWRFSTTHVRGCRGRSGRARRFEVPLKVQAPGEPGEYLLEIDLVQEFVCWFAEKGSNTARAAVKVSQVALP